MDTVILQSDGKPAIVELAEAVAKLRPKTLTRKTPAHSSQSNGAVESCIGHLAGQVRTMRSQIEVMHDVVISPNWCVWSWMARHAAWLASRFSVRASGRTAHEEAFDSEWKGDLCIFGESVLFREAAGYTGQMVGNWTRKKADLQLHRGVYLGRAEQTNEHIVGSKTGIFQTRNVRRLPADQRRDAEGVRGMVGVPWAAQRVMAAPKPKNPAAGALPAPATPVPGSAAAAAGPQAAQAASSVSSGSSSSSGASVVMEDGKEDLGAYRVPPAAGSVGLDGA